MLFAKPEIANDVPLMLLWLRTSDEKFEAVDTCTLYVAAPDEAFQLRVKEVETPVARSAGETNTGATGGATRVVTIMIFELGLVPPAPTARTL